MQFFRSVRVSPGVAIIIAFIAGLAVGSVFPAAEPTFGPVGTIWIKAISALVVPLVVALLIRSIASLADARSVGRIGIRAIAIFLALLIAGAIVIALVTPSLLTLLHVSRTGAVSLNGALLAAPAATAPLGFWQWVAALIPSNPIAAAADGALLPLVIFTVAFGVALTRMKSESSDHVVGFFRGVTDVMLELVRWVLWIAPLGIFGLACTLGARAGASSAHIVVSLVILVAAACIVYICALYVIAVVAGGVSFTTFARAIAPAQIVGFSSRSSLASLPPMIEAADRQLGLPPAITGFLLPLAVSTFKLGATIAFTTSSLFLARLYGVPISAAQLTSIAVSAVIMSFSVPGIPGGVLLIMIPVLTSLGIPAEGVGILLAVDVIPDMFRTVTNVTADMTAAVLVTRWIRSARADPA